VTVSNKDCAAIPEYRLQENGDFQSNQDNPLRDDRKGWAGDRKGAPANDRYCPI